MSRFITVSLDKRGVSCVAKLLDDVAPRTCAAVWDALPLSAPVFHGKYARNEIYTLLPGLRAGRSGEGEHDGDADSRRPVLVLVRLRRSGQSGVRVREHHRHRDPGAIVDLAVFYGRNNLLINGDQGWVPGNVFGAITRIWTSMAAACQDLWMGGARGETLSFTRRV